MVFTLNYYEFWDYNHIAVPLHGRVDLDAIHENINVLVSSLRMSYDKYREAVEKVARNNKVQIVNLSDIIFAPSAVIKEHLICVEGIYPSNRLFPADDLYLIKKQKLYEDIKNVDELDIFGMSPYGDDSLIHIINTKLKVRVFIHNRNLLGGLYRENPVKSRNYEAVKSSKKWENVGNSYIIPALLLYRYSYI